MLTPTLRVLLAAALFSYVAGSAISLTSSAISIKPLVSSNLTLTCTLHDTAPVGPAVGRRSVPQAHDVITGQNDKDGNDGNHQKSSDHPDDLDLADDAVTQTTDNVQFVTSMVVSRDGVDLVTISEHFPVRQLVPGFTVTGHLTGGAGERGRLQLTWPHPTQAEAGTYRCNAGSLSSQGHTVVFSQTVKVVDEEVSINDLVNKLHTIEMEKEAMQSKIQEMETSENKSKAEMQLKIRTLESAHNLSLEEMKKSENQLKDDMQLKINAVNKSLESLRAIARVEPDIFFTALLPSTKTIAKNQVVVYDKVVTNQGAAYNSHTGKFTAPLDGYFHFELHAFTLGSYDEYLGLRHNGNVVVSTSHHGDDFTGSSNSVTLRLAKDDVVDVVGTHGNSQLLYDSLRIQNSLSGRLIALV